MAFCSLSKVLGKNFGLSRALEGLGWGKGPCLRGYRFGGVCVCGGTGLGGGFCLLSWALPVLQRAAGVPTLNPKPKPINPLNRGIGFRVVAGCRDQGFYGNVGM